MRVYAMRGCVRVCVYCVCVMFVICVMSVQCVCVYSVYVCLIDRVGGLCVCIYVTYILL